MGENTEKECYKAVTHVIFDVDGVLLGLHIVVCDLHYDLFTDYDV